MPGSIDLHKYRTLSEVDDRVALQQVQARVQDVGGVDYGATVVIRKGQGNGPDGAHLLGAYTPYTDPTTSGNLWSGITVEFEDGAIVEPWHPDIPCIFLAEVQKITPPGVMDERSGVFKDITITAPHIRRSPEAINRTEADARLRENFGDIVVSGTSGLRVTDAFSYGQRGDFLHVGTSYIGGSDRAYHNDDVTVERCKGDGVTGMCRNFISVVDCTKFRASDIEAKNITIPTWPGLFDFERHPHSVNAIVDDVEVKRATLRNSGGSAISLLLAANPSDTARRFLFEDVWAHDSMFGQFIADGGADPTTGDQILFVRGGSDGCTYPFILRGGKGMRFEDFTHGGGNASIGYPGVGYPTDAVFVGGDFGGANLMVHGASRCRLIDCHGYKLISQPTPFPTDITETWTATPLPEPPPPPAPEPLPSVIVDPAPLVPVDKKSHAGVIIAAAVVAVAILIYMLTYA